MPEYDTSLNEQVRLAHLAIQRFDFPAAVHHYEEAVGLAPDDMRLRLGYAKALSMTPDGFAEAHRQAKLVVARNHGSADAHIFMGDLLYDNGRYEEAALSFKRAIAWDSGNREARRRLTEAQNEAARMKNSRGLISKLLPWRSVSRR